MAAWTFRMSAQPCNVLYVCLKNQPDFVLLIVNCKVKANAVPLYWPITATLGNQTNRL